MTGFLIFLVYFGGVVASKHQQGWGLRAAFWPYDLGKKLVRWADAE